MRTTMATRNLLKNLPLSGEETGEETGGETGETGGVILLSQRRGGGGKWGCWVNKMSNSCGGCFEGNRVRM